MIAKIFKKIVLNLFVILIVIAVFWIPWKCLTLSAIAPDSAVGQRPGFNYDSEIGALSFNQSKSTFFCYPIASSVDWFVRALPQEEFPVSSLTSNKVINKDFIIPTLGLYVVWQGSTAIHHCIPTSKDAIWSLTQQKFAS
jgi:hypothetical protein